MDSLKDHDLLVRLDERMTKLYPMVEQMQGDFEGVKLFVKEHVSRTEGELIPRFISLEKIVRGDPLDNDELRKKGLLQLRQGDIDSHSKFKKIVTACMVIMPPGIIGLLELLYRLGILNV